MIAYFFLYCPTFSILHIFFWESATDSYSLEQVFVETKQNLLKVAGYKPTTFVKYNFSQVIFEDFQFQLQVVSPYI